MREIKFRAWDKKNKKMLHVDHGDICSCGGLTYEISPIQIEVDEWFTPTEAKWFEHNNGERPRDPVSEDFELMQYTGLKDKNGKEIYEGDVLREKYGFDGQEWNYYVVRFGVSQELRIGFFLEGYGGAATPHVFERAEVIGNIYENPELLKYQIK
jgi:uncharacterized phage protein (TIGR01671 family)